MNFVGIALTNPKTVSSPSPISVTSTNCKVEDSLHCSPLLLFVCAFAKKALCFSITIAANLF